VRDDPPDRPAPPRRAETLREALAGQVSIWRLPGLPRVLSMHLVAYAAAATVIGLWAGPYLADVHGLDAAGRGWALAAMGWRCRRGCSASARWSARRGGGG
jgi:predicted MFS family arabinose efflux permease